MTEPLIPPAPTTTTSGHSADVLAIADAARDLAMKFADAADQGPNSAPFDPIVVLTALQVFTASVILDAVPEENWQKTLEVLGFGVANRLKELKEIADDFIDIDVNNPAMGES